MRNNKSIHNATATILQTFGHLFFLLGVCVLIYGSRHLDDPIGLDGNIFLLAMAQFTLGYICVFLYWVFCVDRTEVFRGGADAVPDFITSRLFGKFPYLFSFRAPKGSAPGFHGKKYLDGLYGKGLADVYCDYVSKQFLYALIFVVILIPFAFADQSPPEFLAIILNWSVGFSIFVSFLSTTWLSAMALLALRFFFCIRK